MENKRLELIKLNQHLDSYFTDEEWELFKEAEDAAWKEEQEKKKAGN
jgi:hypothetical protein